MASTRLKVGAGAASLVLSLAAGVVVHFEGYLAAAYGAVQRCIHVPLKPYEAAAFTSFTYNVGATAFCQSTLARKANSGDMPGACAEMSRWVYSDGEKLPGLVRRRAAERALCKGKQS